MNRTYRNAKYKLHDLVHVNANKISLIEFPFKLSFSLFYSFKFHMSFLFQKIKKIKKRKKFHMSFNILDQGKDVSILQLIIMINILHIFLVNVQYNLASMKMVNIDYTTIKNSVDARYIGSINIAHS